MFFNKGYLYSFVFISMQTDQQLVARESRNSRDGARVHAWALARRQSRLYQPTSLFRVLPPPTPLHSVSPNPRCWYRETRWSASNQRQDPSSSFASSYSWRMRVEGVVLSVFLSPPLSLFRFAVARASLAAIFLELPPQKIQQLWSLILVLPAETPNFA